MDTSRLTRPVKRVALGVLLSLAAASLLAGGAFQGPSRAQTGANPPQAAGEGAAPAEVKVNREGHTLKPSGLALNNLPTARFDFSIEKRDPRTGKDVPFSGLKAADIEVQLDSQPPFRPAEGDLKLTGSDPAKVVIMLDGSGSMVIRKVAGVDKLSAAKSAINTFVNNLRPDDSVAVGTFDETVNWLSDFTTDKSRLADDVEGFEVILPGALYTRLYDAAEAAVKKAAESKAKYVILISDGWEDSPESKGLKGAALDAFKAEQEERITRLAREKDVRVYTIAIGDEQGEGLARVDRPSLEKLSKNTNGGDPVYVCVPQFGLESNCPEPVTQELLEQKLRQTLEQIKQSFRYNYSLEMRLGQNLTRDVEHKLLIDSSVALPRAASERERRVVHLPIEYYFRWPAGQLAGIITDQNLLKPAIFIQTAPLTVAAGKLGLLYVLTMALLFSAGVIPLILGWVIQTSRTSGAVKTLKARSQLIGQVCEHEKSFGQRRRDRLFKEGDAVVICPNPKCKRPHHLECWLFNKNKCFNRNCEFPMEIPANVLSKHGVDASELTA